jgi:hypothetical protein
MWPRGAFALVTVVLVMASVAALLRLSMALPVGVGSPSPEPSGTPQMSELPTTPPPTPPPGSVTPGDFVRGPYGCGDGIGGFIVWIPDGWFANSARDGLPACRFVSTQEFVLNDLDDPPSVPITLSIETGDYESRGEVIERTERSLEGGLPALRLIERVENGLRLVYVVGLDGSLPSEGSPVSYLLAMTTFGDPTYDRDSAALDEMLNRFTIRQDPYVHDAAAAAEAESLFAQTLTCVNAELRFEVAYPANWFTNPVTPELPACTWFGPTQIPEGNPYERPEDVVISMTVYEGGVAGGASFFFESRNVGGRPARLTEEYGGFQWEPDTTVHIYRYLVEFGEFVSGTNLVAATDTTVGFDYSVAKEVLDRMMASLTLVD